MHRVSSALLDNSEFGRQFIVYSGLFLFQQATFLIQRGFESKYALEGALGPSWTRFWCSWASLGGSFDAFAASRWQL